VCAKKEFRKDPGGEYYQQGCTQYYIKKMPRQEATINYYTQMIFIGIFTIAVNPDTKNSGDLAPAGPVN